MSDARDRYLRRVYTDRELEDCRAGEGLPLNTIEVRSGPGGEVELALSGPAAEVAAAAGVTELALSLTHEGGFAAAAVVLS
jgi:phosphopantetheinyl transferase (holo-ACP synthase)